MVRQVAKARDEVARTSGARGLANRKELRRLEAALRGLTLPEGDAAGVDATIQGHLSSLYEAVEPEAELQGRAEKVLLSLGFKPAMIQVRRRLRSASLPPPGGVHVACEHRGTARHV